MLAAQFQNHQSPVTFTFNFLPNKPVADTDNGQQVTTGNSDQKKKKKKKKKKLGNEEAEVKTAVPHSTEEEEKEQEQKESNTIGENHEEPLTNNPPPPPPPEISKTEVSASSSTIESKEIISGLSSKKKQKKKMKKQDIQTPSSLIQTNTKSSSKPTKVSAPSQSQTKKSIPQKTIPETKPPSKVIQGPSVLSYRDPELTDEERNKRKYGSGLNLSTGGVSVGGTEIGIKQKRSISSWAPPPPGFEDFLPSHPMATMTTEGNSSDLTDQLSHLSLNSKPKENDGKLKSTGWSPFSFGFQL